MNRVNIHEAKANLSRILDETPPGQVVLICRRNLPVAELRVLPRSRVAPRPVGLARGKGVLPPSFFDPLPESMLAVFHGQGL